MRQNKLKTQDIVVMYTVQHLTLRQIASLVNMSHVAVAKRLKSAGIDAKQGEWVVSDCAFCGRSFAHPRCRWRRAKDHFCGSACYYASLENPGYKPWRNGGRLARAIVAQYFKLEPGHIVHHKDGDQRNNDRANLAVVRDRAHHLRVHRYGATDYLWDGAQN